MNLSTNSSATGRSTKILFTELHNCPALRNDRLTPSATALSRGASPLTIIGEWPPSSSVTRLTSLAAISRIRFPVAVPPVKLILATFGWLASRPPTAAPSPLTELSTPGGRPEAFAPATRSSAARGVSSAGLATTVQPAARAGAIFQAIIPRG